MIQYARLFNGNKAICKNKENLKAVVTEFGLI